MSVSIKNLQRYGENGWQWVVESMVDDWNPKTGKYEEYLHSTPMRTNEQGNGLWYVGSYEGQWADNYQDKQSQGTAQFSLPKSKRAARSKLYREFRNE